jgi:hypothetical protein
MVMSRWDNWTTGNEECFLQTHHILFLPVVYTLFYILPMKETETQLVLVLRQGYAPENVTQIEHKIPI